MPSGPNTIVGAIELRGRLPPSTRFATRYPSFTGTMSKSVSWLLRIAPSTVRPEPNGPSTVVVTSTTLPAPSVTARSVVPATSCTLASTRFGAPGGVPAAMLVIVFVGSISFERLAM